MNLALLVSHQWWLHGCIYVYFLHLAFDSSSISNATKVKILEKILQQIFVRFKSHIFCKFSFRFKGTLNFLSLFCNIFVWIVRVHLRELYRKRGQSWGNPPPPPSVLSSPLFQNFLLAALIKILPHQPLKNVLHLLHRQLARASINQKMMIFWPMYWGGETVNWPTCDDICLVRDRITRQEIWHFLPSEILIYQCK